MTYRVTGWRLKLRIGLALLGVLLGVGASVAFAVTFQNIHLSIWSILSAAWAAKTLILHLAVYRDKERKISHSTFTHTLVVGAIGMVAGFVAFAVYLANGILDKETKDKSKSRYFLIAAVLLLSKWGLALLLHSKWYKDELSKAITGDDDKLTDRKETSSV